MVARVAYYETCLMINETSDRIDRLRTLECWLPLAQDLNTTERWGYDAPSLQAFVLVALPALLQTCSATEARAILRSIHLTRRQDFQVWQGE